MNPGHPAKGTERNATSYAVYDFNITSTTVLLTGPSNARFFPLHFLRVESTASLLSSHTPLHQVLNREVLRVGGKEGEIVKS
jgi:hypothetical protein